MSVEKIRIRCDGLDRHRRPIVEHYRSVGKFVVLIAFHAQYGVHGGAAVFGPDVDREQRVIRQAETVCEVLDLAMREDAPAIHKFADVTLSCHSLMLFLIEPEITVCREADRRECYQPDRRLRDLDLNRLVEGYVAGRDDMDDAGSGGKDRNASVGSYRYGLIVAEEQYIRLDAGRSECGADEILRHIADQQARGVFYRHCSRHKIQRFQFRSGGDHLLAILFRLNRGGGGIAGVRGCGIGGGRSFLCFLCGIDGRLGTLRCCIGDIGGIFCRRFHPLDDRLDIFERHLDALVEYIDTDSPQPFE